MGSDSSKRCPAIEFEEASNADRMISLSVTIVSLAVIAIFLPWYLWRSVVDDYIRRRDIFLVCVQTLGALVTIGFLVQEIAGRKKFPCVITRNIITLNVLFLYFPHYLRNIKFYFRIKLNKLLSYEIFASAAMDSPFMQESTRAEHQSFADKPGFGELYSKTLSQSMTRSASYSSSTGPHKSFNYGSTLNLSLFTDPASITFADEAYSETGSFSSQLSNGVRHPSERSSGADMQSGNNIKDRRKSMQWSMYLASDKFLRAFYICAAIVTLAIAMPLSRDIVGCSGCEVLFTDLVIFFVFSITSGPFLAYIVWQIRKEPDPLGLKFELAWWILMFGGPVMMAWIILYYWDPNELMNDGFLTWHYIYVFAVIGTWIVIVPYAIWKGYKVNAKKKSLGEHPELITVLSSKIGMRLFQTHLANELSIENIMFWSEANSWKKNFKKFASRRKREMKMNQIWNVFIDETSSLQVNLPADARERIEAAVKSRKKITADLFDDAIEEIYKLMENHSFPRFIQSELYEKYQSNDFSALI